MTHHRRARPLAPGTDADRQALQAVPPGETGSHAEIARRLATRPRDRARVHADLGAAMRDSWRGATGLAARLSDAA